VKTKVRLQRLPARRVARGPVRELAVIQDEQGYLSSAVIEATGRSGFSSALRDLRDRERLVLAVRAELALLREVSVGADVVRETHIASGDRSCTTDLGDGRGLAAGALRLRLRLLALHEPARGAGRKPARSTSETFGTNDAPSDVAAAAS